MELEYTKEKALLFWFNTYGTSINLEIVNSLSSLWFAHVPSLLNCLRTDDNTRITASSALSSYQDLFSHFLVANGQDEIIESLSVEKAAEGNSLEIAKFLAVLLNEFRISKPDVITESVAVMQRDGHDVPLKEILNAFDGERNEWWSVMIKPSETEVAVYDYNCVTPHRSSPSAEEFSGMSVSRSSFVTPCGPNRRRNNSTNPGVHTVARCDCSPLMDAINSPKVRELRREREIKTLRRQLNEIEDQLMHSESQFSESRSKIELLIGEISNKNERIRELESCGKLSQRSQQELESKVVILTKQLEQYQRQCHSQKERLAAYKLNTEELEEKQLELNEQLQAKRLSITALERELRDVKDEAVGSIQHVRILDNERTNLIRILEEERRVAALEREQYQAAVSEWRKRLEKETSDIMSLYTTEMAKNASLQQEIREKSEHLEKVQNLYDSDKRSFENAIQEIKVRLQEKHDVAMKKFTEAEAKLSHQEERHRSFVNEHGAIVQQLESVHLAETVQLESKISSACTRIEELESILIERDRTICEQRKDLTKITTEKEAAESKFGNLQIVLQKKEDQLNEANTTVEKLEEDVQFVTSKYNETARSAELLQAECLKLQSAISRKDVEISELHIRVKDLTSLSKVYNEALDEYKHTQQYLDEERMRLRCQNSETEAIIESLKQKLYAAEESAVKTMAFVQDREEDWKVKEQNFKRYSAEAKDEIVTLKSRICKLEEELFQERNAVEELRTQFGGALVVMEGKNRCHAEALSMLEEKIGVLRNVAKFYDEHFRSKTECEQLCGRNAVKRDEILALLKKFELLENEVCKADERNSKLELEIKMLREENALCSKYMEMLRFGGDPHLSPSQESMKSLSKAYTSKGDHAYTFSPMEKSCLFENEEEPILCDLRTSSGEWMEMEGKHAVSCNTSVSNIDQQPPRQHDSSNVVSKCESVASLAPSSAYSSTLSLPKSNSSKRSLIESLKPSKAKEIASSATDRRRVSELQKRNAMIHPAMRCAYATEVAGYNSPSGSENVVKHGNQSERRKSGVKFLLRASSYVRKKLPLSESTNSQQ